MCFRHKGISSDIRREAGISPFLETNVAKKREVCLRYERGKSGRIDIAFDEERRRAEQYRLLTVVRFVSFEKKHGTLREVGSLGRAP
jgi:hypothetical protein